MCLNNRTVKTSTLFHPGKTMLYMNTMEKPNLTVLTVDFAMDFVKAEALQASGRV